jgi:hypothetical protein
MTQGIPIDLMTETNRGVLAHIEGMSAHSDIADVLAAAVKPLGDVQIFCPDLRQYRYVAASTKGVIFGFAIGMNTVAFRLDDRLKNRALITGASACLECGPDWVSFIAFRDDWPRFDFEFWARKAYVYAREPSP